MWMSATLSHLHAIKHVKMSLDHTNVVVIMVTDLVWTTVLVMVNLLCYSHITMISFWTRNSFLMGYDLCFWLFILKNLKKINLYHLFKSQTVFKCINGWFYSMPLHYVSIAQSSCKNLTRLVTNKQRINNSMY